MVFLAIFWATAPLHRREKGWTAPMQPAHWEIHVCCIEAIREQWETASAIKCYKDGYVSWIPHEVNSTGESRTPYACFYFGFDSCIIIWSKQKIAGFIYRHWLPFANFLATMVMGELLDCWLRDLEVSAGKVENLKFGWCERDECIITKRFLGQDMFKTCFFVWIRCGTVFFQNGPPKRHSI